MTPKIFPLILATLLATGAHAQTTVTVEAVLKFSGEVVTDLIDIRAYETVLPDTPDPEFELERYARLDASPTAANVFEVPADMPIGLWSFVAGPDIAPTALRPEGDAMTHTLHLEGGILRLNVISDGPPDFFVQADSDLNAERFYSYSTGVPDSGEVVFLLPPGRWNVFAIGPFEDTPLLVEMQHGVIIDATLDVREE